MEDADDDDDGWLWSATMMGDNSGGHNNQPHW
jgi:hypothetical protein